MYKTDSFCMHDILCYDDGCHLRKNPVHANKSTTATKLSKLNIVIDKMHFTGHMDEVNCNPYKIEELDKVTLCWLILLMA